MNKTDKENEYKNAVLIRFRNKEKALKYFKAYNGQIQDTDLIGLCNFDDPHSLKAELEKAREVIRFYSDINNCKVVVEDHEDARPCKTMSGGLYMTGKKAKEFLKREGE